MNSRSGPNTTTDQPSVATWLTLFDVLFCHLKQWQCRACARCERRQPAKEAQTSRQKPPKIMSFRQQSPVTYQISQDWFTHVLDKDGWKMKSSASTEVLYGTNLEKTVVWNSTKQNSMAEREKWEQLQMLQGLQDALLGETLMGRNYHLSASQHLPQGENTSTCGNRLLSCRKHALWTTTWEGLTLTWMVVLPEGLHTLIQTVAAPTRHFLYGNYVLQEE